MRLLVMVYLSEQIRGGAGGGQGVPEPGQRVRVEHFLGVRGLRFLEQQG